MSKQRFMSSRGIRNYVINMRTLLTGEKQRDPQEVKITPMPQVTTSRCEAKPCRAACAQRCPLCARRLEAGLTCGRGRPSSACACLCFQLPLEFTAGNGEGEVDDVRDKGQSCREGRAARKEVERVSEISVGEPGF